MKIQRPFDWLSRFLNGIRQPTDGFNMVEVLQPTVDCSCDWPLEVRSVQKTGTLAVGTNIFNFPDDFVGQEFKAGYHYRVVEAIIKPGASLTCDLFAFQGGEERGKYYDGAAATTHFPFLVTPRSIYLVFGTNSIKIQILAAAGTESFKFDFQYWARKQSEPIPSSAF